MLRVEGEEEEPATTTGVDVEEAAAAACEKAPHVGEDGESEDVVEIDAGSGGKMGRLRSAAERTTPPPQPPRDPPSGGEGDNSICDGFRIW